MVEITLYTVEQLKQATTASYLKSCSMCPSFLMLLSSVTQCGNSWCHPSVVYFFPHQITQNP